MFVCNSGEGEIFYLIEGQFIRAKQICRGDRPCGPCLDLPFPCRFLKKKCPIARLIFHLNCSGNPLSSRASFQPVHHHMWSTPLDTWTFLASVWTLTQFLPVHFNQSQHTLCLLYGFRGCTAPWIPLRKGKSWPWKALKFRYSPVWTLDYP